MSNSSEPTDSEPIDVEFQPAEPSDVKAKQKSSGPGWMGLISAGVLAALGGGAIGVVASGTEGRYAQAAEVAVDISKLEEYDRTLESQITQIRNDLRDTEAQLNTALEQVQSSEDAAGEELREIRADFNRLRTRYIALLGEDGDAESPEGEAGEQTAEERPNALPMPTVSLAALMERLNAIESVETGGVAVPENLTRTVASLQQRATQLETADRELAETLEARSESLTTLEEEISTLEASLQDVTARTGVVETAQAGGTQSLEDVKSDLAALRRSVNQKLSNLEEAELTESEENLVKRADRVLALSALEAATDEGAGFATELEALAIQMPANAGISALRRMADDGAPTLEMLQRQLVDLRDEVANAGIPDQPTGQWAWVGELLSGVVTMREESSADGQTASSRIDEAVEFLERDDLTSALREVRKINGQQGEVLAGWVADAEQRQSLDRLMERLGNDVLDGDIDE
ncbi:MAG: hypothetical protein CMK07_16120 [Ponticaulis sp.]|nr:hypothetical protein [Ponticaulis sp.]